MKPILSMLLLASVVFAHHSDTSDECSEFEKQGQKWYVEAEDSFLKESFIREYGRSSYYMQKAIICQNKKILEKGLKND